MSTHPMSHAMPAEKPTLVAAHLDDVWRQRLLRLAWPLLGVAASALAGLLAKRAVGMLAKRLER